MALKSYIQFKKRRAQIHTTMDGDMLILSVALPSLLSKKHYVEFVRHYGFRGSYKATDVEKFILKKLKK